jgi:hypothetical protein
VRIGISPYGADRAAALQLTETAISGGIDPAGRGGEFRRRLGELRAKLAGDTLSPRPHTPQDNAGVTPR